MITGRFASPRKRARRAQLEAEFGARQKALLDKRYGVILRRSALALRALIPRYRNGSRRQNHYPTSDLAKIKALDVKSIAAANCVLFLWAMVPMLPQAIEVMKA
jgi:N6-adenosine-specific RNA methylase IME4